MTTDSRAAKPRAPGTLPGAGVARVDGMGGITHPVTGPQREPGRSVPPDGGPLGPGASRPNAPRPDLTGLPPVLPEDQR